MSGNPPVKLETDEQVLAFTLDVVIPAMREMYFVEDTQRPQPGRGPQVWFRYYENDSPGEGFEDTEERCGSFACLGGWFKRMSGQTYYRLTFAFENKQDDSLFSICAATHAFSNGGTAREELEARAAAIAKVLGRE